MKIIAEHFKYNLLLIMSKVNFKWFNVFVEVMYFPFRYFVINEMCIMQ